MALKAFTDQKKRFFPHLIGGSETEPPLKKFCGNQPSSVGHEEELGNLGTVSDILLSLEKEVQHVKTCTYQRLDWLKRASLLPTVSNETSTESSVQRDFRSSNDLRQGGDEDDASDKVAVIELLCPSIFRAVISLHPAGSVYPDAVAFFSPDEVLFLTYAQFIILYTYTKFILFFWG